MAAVTQCDVCNNVVKHEQAMYIKAYSCNKNGETSQCIWCKDLCPECYSKLCRLVGEVPK